MTDISGRWAGRLTSRPLADVDETIDALTKEERAACVVEWLGRAAAERRASDAFQVIESALASVDADPVLRSLGTRAIDDELRHAEICRLVAERYAGHALEAPKRLSLEAPAHAEAPARLRPALHVIGQCAINETTATAYLEACLASARGPLVRGALRELLSDDVDHARIGWAFLVSLTPEAKRAIEPFLVPMVRAHVRTWRKPSPPRPSARLSEHGALDPKAIDEAVVESVRALIVPGLDAVGIESAGLRGWLDAGACS